MKKIGMFYGNRNVMLESFEKHANSIGPNFSGDVIVCPRTLSINIGGKYKYMYYSFERDGEALQRIQGIEFDAMFTQNLNEHCQRYVLSRFRPRF